MCDPEESTDDPFLVAARHGHIETVRMLVQSGACASDVDAALVESAAGGHTATVSFLLKHKADLHSLNDYPLRRAAYHGRTETVRVLLDARANVHALDAYSNLPDCPLRVSVSNGHVETVNVLLEHKADVHAQGGPHYASDWSLYLAAYWGYTDIVRLLIKHQANVHAVAATQEPDRILRAAVENGHLVTAEILLHECGAGSAQYLAPSFVETHLSVKRQNVLVDNVARCMRLSQPRSRPRDSILHVLYDASHCSTGGADNNISRSSLYQDLSRVRKSWVDIVALGTGCCMDLCELVLCCV